MSFDMGIYGSFYKLFKETELKKCHILMEWRNTKIRLQ